MTELRRIPSVDQVLRQPEMSSLVTRYGHQRIVDGLRGYLEEVRGNVINGGTIPTITEIAENVATKLEVEGKNSLYPMINATGVILHTNLGRAPLGNDALKAIQQVASGYSNLEYDVEKGVRGSRSDHVSALLCLLTGAEDAFVVNNNAAAVMLCLSALVRRRQVVISRSQLVEIGGGFRVPDVLKQSGSKLVEVGTTNRVHLDDYETALKEGASMVLRVHSSNFKLVGFTTQPLLADIVSVAHQYHVPLLDDLGSGALLDTAAYGLAHEPMVQESIQAGADLVCFSGDKLLGGPQAGIIVGRRVLISKIKRHPLARALRNDKMTLAGLEATLLHYLNGDAQKMVPVWQMISATTENLKTRAESWRSGISCGSVIEERSTVGGGSLPEETLPTFVLALEPPRVNEFVGLLRQAVPPIICRVQNNKVLFDPRTVMREDDQKLIDNINISLSRSNHEI